MSGAIELLLDDLLDKLLLEIDELEELLKLVDDLLDELLGNSPWESLDELLEKLLNELSAELLELKLPGKLISGSLEEEFDVIPDELNPSV